MESNIPFRVVEPSFTLFPCLQGVSKKRNTFDLKYLKDGSTYLIVLLVCYSVLPYNSFEPNFGFLQRLQLGPLKSDNFENDAKCNYSTHDIVSLSN